MNKLQLSGALGVIALVIGLMTFSINDAGYIQIVQHFNGSMAVQTTPGPFFDLGADNHEYQISDMFYFSKHEEEGGDGLEAQPIEVRFTDGGKAKYSGSIKYRLPTSKEKLLKIHGEFKSYETLQSDLVRQIVTEALIQTATLMKAEESYSSRRSEFTELAEGQIQYGIYATKSREVKTKNQDGKVEIEKLVEVVLDSTGAPVVRKPSPFKDYGIQILQFVIKDIDYDDDIDASIAVKKRNEQERMVSKSEAEKAKQKAITEKAQGDARIAKAKADEEVKKIAEVTQAEKNAKVAGIQAKQKYEVAKYEALQAKEVAKKIIEEGRAEAEANRLKVKAGLTPQEKAEWEYKTAVGVAEKLSNVAVPDFVVSGGDGGANPMNAIGVNMLLDIQKRMKGK